MEYQAQSPDEVALCQAARANHYTFHDKSQKGMTLTIRGEEVFFPVLCVMEFDSSRRRMSIIVRMPSGNVRMYSKGAG